MVGTGQANARALQHALDNLDVNLAATQLGITISSLALGWIGEPALAHLIEPMLAWLPGDAEIVGAHVIAVAISFAIITAFHIVLGELAPKSLALQRSERTALWVVRPLRLFLLLRPAIVVLNGLGNLTLRLFGLRPGNAEEALHSPDELKLLVTASHEAGLLHEAQQDLAQRAFALGNRRIGDIMTPRREIDWIDLDDDAQMIARAVRASPREQLLVGRGDIHDPLGIVLKKDLLDQLLDGQPLAVSTALRKTDFVHQATPIVQVIERFKRTPVRLVMVIDDYGDLEGIVSETDLLEALAGELAEADEHAPALVEREDGSLLIDGMTPAHEAFRHLGLREPSTGMNYYTAAGFALSLLGRLPATGEIFRYQGWQFEVVDMDGRRIDKLLATRPKRAAAAQKLD